MAFACLKSLSNKKWRSRAFAAFILCAWLASLSWADLGRHMRTDKVLEVSLSGLRESAKQVAQRNDWLIQAIKQYRAQIPYLENMVFQYHQTAATKSESNNNFDGYIDLSAVELTDQPPSGVGLGVQANGGPRTSEQLRAGIQQLQAQIQTMKTALPHSQGIIGSADMVFEKKEIINKLESSNNRIISLQKEIRNLRREFKGPLADYEEVKVQRDQVSHELMLRTAEYTGIVKQKSGLESEIQQMTSNNKAYGDKLISTLKSLNDRKSLLDSSLQEAERRVKLRNLDFRISEQEIDRLLDNLYTIKKENELLKGEVSRIDHSSRPDQQAMAQ